MKPFILVCDGMDQTSFEQLQTVSEFEVHPKKKNTQEEIMELLPKASALVVRSATKPNQEFLDRAENLKLIIRAGEGTDNIDKTYANSKDIRVANTPGANNNSAAEHAIALMMSALRRTPWAHESMKEGKWDKAAFTGLELWKKKVGVVGFGRIGQIVAKRIQGFEIETLFFDPFVEKTDIPNARKVELDELFRESDIVTIHTPLMEQTKNMVNYDLMSSMNHNSILVNCARGGIVNEADLLKILQENSIRAAAFDVFASEPLEENSPLRELPNFIMTPHLGASTEEAQSRVGEMSVHQLKEFFLSNNLLNEVKGK